MIDTAAVQAAKPNLQDYRNAEVKRDRWLLELEQALLVIGARRGPDDGANGVEQSVSTGTVEDSQPAARNDGMPHANKGHTADHGATVGLTERAGNTSAVTERGQVAAHVASIANSHSGMHRAFSSVEDNSRPTVSAQSMEATTPQTGVEATSGMAASAVVPGNGTVAGAPVSQAVVNQASATQASATQASATQASVIQVVTQAVSAEAVAAIAKHMVVGYVAPDAESPAAVQLAGQNALRPLAAGFPAGQVPLKEPVTLPEAQEPPSQEGAPREAEREPFEKRLMHLFQGADGVQAWVRDAELGAAQARGLALALASELGGAGERLAALTVNGRKVELVAEAVSESDMPAESGQLRRGPAVMHVEITSKGQY